MTDPLLSSLCSICHIQIPKYCCPRCSIQTCSLTCSRRHKVWSSCNGIRDPTVFKPKSQLATPSGIDHDYNFLHAIGSKIERSEKEIVLERMLVSKEELQRARMGERSGWQDGRQRKPKLQPGEESIERMLRAMNTRVERAPKGMKRNVENTTSWSKRRKTIHWHVEWIQMGSGARSCYKALGDLPIGEVYATKCREEESERKTSKKRKGFRQRTRSAKRRRFGEALTLLTSGAVQTLQNAETGAWDCEPAQPVEQCDRHSSCEPEEAAQNDFQLYLLRPYTPSNSPKVLTPLSPNKPLSKLLRFRILLEFPTIYVQDGSTRALPQQFMLEEEYCAKTGEIMPLDSDAEKEYCEKTGEPLPSDEEMEMLKDKGGESGTEGAAARDHQHGIEDEESMNNSDSDSNGESEGDSVEEPFSSADQTEVEDDAADTSSSGSDSDELTEEDEEGM